MALTSPDNIPYVGATQYAEDADVPDITEDMALAIQAAFTSYNSQLRAYALSLIPPGIIWEYAGNSAPDGWAICNGTPHGSSALAAIIGPNTPDLQDRFVVGASATKTMRSTGGQETVALTAANMPTHNHGGATGSEGSHTHNGTTNSGNATHGHAGSTSSESAYHTHSGNVNAVGDHAHSYERGELFAGQGMQTGSTLVGQIKYSNNVYSTSSAGAHGHGFVTDGASPWHSHTVSADSVDAPHQHTFSTGGASVNHTHTIANAGSGTAHNNVPPYYAVMFIIKK